MYAITGDFRRFCFDRAVVTFGRALEAELDGVTAKTDTARNVKRQRILDTWLGRELKFRNPVATKKTASPTKDVEQEFVMKGDGT